MEKRELVIVGGGLAAARAIESYREAGGDGRIVLVAEEATLPYHRPALSKRYLRGEARETPFVEDEAFYRDNDVDVRLETRVAAVDSGGGEVTVDDGSRLRYDRLLLATGAVPRRLQVPGADLDGVFALRTVQDSAAIRDAAHTAERAVVVGGGFIGMEAAASLRRLGLDVTLIHLGHGLFDQLGSTELSGQLAGLYRGQDVQLLLGHEVAGFGGDGALTHVETKSGLRVAADLAVVGVGVVPNVGFLPGSGLAVDNGIVVDTQFETKAPGVYAVGDVAAFFDPLYGRRRRIEHWSNASYQGTEVGRILAGGEGGYDTVSSFFTEVFGTTIKVFGDVTRNDTLTTEGSLDAGFLAAYGHEGRLVGALTVGQSEEVESLVKQLISARAPAHALARGLLAA
ncbi:MAG TPA: FAD-dependent oxidoreductase [Gaiellaceae bacterium]|nr:FAD-dependent oxidoreductase [Gaiellaceae bacterium]